MAATWSAYQNALKEVWTSDTLKAQLATDDKILSRLEATDKYQVGEYAIVPTKTSRGGGFSVASSSGSSALNAASNVSIGQPQYSLAWHYGSINIEHAAIESTGSKASAVAEVVDTEVSDAVDELRTQLCRELYGNGDSLIATCGTTTSSTTVVLDPTTGYDAIVRQWLHPGLVIDIGTSASEASVAGDITISSVTKSSTAPKIVVSGSAITTSSANFVSVANARSGSTSYEANGLQNIISTSASLGGVSAGGQWQAASVDSTTTDLTLDAMLACQEAVMQETGVFEIDVLTSFRQQRRFYNLFQNQVRFSSDTGISAGSTDSIKWNGMTVQGQYHCPSTKMFFVNFDDLLLVTGRHGLHWFDEITGGERLTQKALSTAFTATLAYPLNMAARRRCSHAALTALT